MARLIDLICGPCAARILDSQVWTPPRRCGDCATAGAGPNLADLDIRESAAIHEAAHVIVGLAHEYHINYASLESSGRRGSAGHYSAQVWDYQVGSSGHAVMALAGAAGARRWARALGHTSEADMLEVANTGLSDVGEMYGYGWTHRDLADRVADAKALVDRYWTAIERVAGGLLSSGRLGGGEIISLARIKEG